MMFDFLMQVLANFLSIFLKNQFFLEKLFCFSTDFGLQGSKMFVSMRYTRVQNLGSRFQLLPCQTKRCKFWGIFYQFFFKKSVFPRKTFLFFNRFWTSRWQNVRLDEIHTCTKFGVKILTPSLSDQTMQVLGNFLSIFL